MNVLSLFDGISCARVALEKNDIDCENYFASEIDKYAIKISKKNYPDIVQLGDVTKIDGKDLPPIDLMVGGSPCQDLSINKRDRKGLEGERSGLFFVYVKLLKQIKPKFFILENVFSMSEESKDIISRYLEVQPILLDSRMVSAQMRKRLFWVGKFENDTIEQVHIPELVEDSPMVLRDILEDNVDEKFYLSDLQIERINKSNFNDRKPMNIDRKCHTLKVGGDVKRVVLDDGRWRHLTPVEYCRLQGLPDLYTEGVSKTQQYKCVGNAFHVDIIRHILTHLI